MTTLHWTAGVHHDGSLMYVSNPRPEFHEQVTITLRTTASAPIQRIFLRTTPDGEQHLEAMTIIRKDGVSVYWQATLKMTMPLVHYNFRLVTDEGVWFYTALGASRADSPDSSNFKLIADFDGPTWLDDAVFYQIFPDRFYNGDPSLTPQPGAWTRRDHAVTVPEWERLPVPYSEAGNLDFYGGDLPGIQQKLEYLGQLGINAIYLTPIFPSPSNHRYNADDFMLVDPHLGGDEALTALTDAMHARDMHLILDLTTNHSGSTHQWFVAAQSDPDAHSIEFYTFNQHPHDYESWLGVASLPKLNYRSGKLRDIMYRGSNSIMQHWLNAPFNIDGWRLDVANMTARQGRDQLSQEVYREMRESIKQQKPEAYIFGEDFFDGTPYLQGDMLDGTMNYKGFNIPTWRWLSGYDSGQAWKPEIADYMRLPSDAYATQLDRFRAAVPWSVAVQQFNQLCSHDTERILTIVGGDVALVKLGTALLMTYIGVPCVYYGDEIRMEGSRDPDNRRTMRWDESTWDADLLDWHKRLIHLRRTAPALLHGGFQWLYAERDLLVYQRQSSHQRLIVVAYRGDDTYARMSIPVWHGGLNDGTVLVDILNDDAEVMVQNGAIVLEGISHGDALVFEAR